MASKTKFRIAGIGLALALAFSFAAVAGPVPEEDHEAIEALKRQGKAFASIARRATPAVVFIKVERTVEARVPQTPFDFPGPFSPFEDDFFDRFFRRESPRRERERPRQQPRQFRQYGQGSGFIISEDGLILTNHHVVGEASELRVKLHDGRELEAKVIGTDPQSDVALIKVEGNNFPTLPLGDSDALEIGEWVMAIGNPFGLAETVTVGVVSAKGRTGVGIADYEDFIQTDAAINPGNSGGPLINLNGEAVGLNTAIFSRTGGYMGIGFAIPMRLARAIKTQLLESGKVVRGYLGVIIQDLTKDLAETFGLDRAEGVLVAEVVKDSPAEKAELKQGDIILQIDGSPAKNVGDLRNKVSLTAPGSNVRLKILRDGKEVEVRVTIGTLPETPEVADVSEVSQKIGLRVQALTEELAQQFGYKVGDGVVVSHVEPGSPAGLAGVQPGTLITSVNRRRVNTVQEYEEALRQSAETKRVLLHIRQDGASRFVVLSFD